MSDTTARNQLAELLADDWNPDRDPILTAMFRDYAQTILAAGWRPPARTITTVKELDALAKGTVVLDAHGRMFQKLLFGWEASGYVGHFDECARPATVLWEPEEGAGE